MRYKLLLRNLKGLRLRKRKQDVRTDLFLLGLQELGMVPAQPLDIPVEVVRNLPLHARELLDFKDLGLFKQRLVLTENRLNCSFQNIGFLLWLSRFLSFRRLRPI